jgi:hypothetical protein
MRTGGADRVAAAVGGEHGSFSFSAPKNRPHTGIRKFKCLVELKQPSMLKTSAMI